MELDESNITHESTLAMLRQKHNGSIAEMGEQIDTLNKAKAKTEKERNGVALEVEETQENLANNQNEKMALDKQDKMIQQQIYDVEGRLQELQRALHEADGSKRKTKQEVEREKEETILIKQSRDEFVNTSSNSDENENLKQELKKMEEQLSNQALEGEVPMEVVMEIKDKLLLLQNQLLENDPEKMRSLEKENANVKRQLEELVSKAEEARKGQLMAVMLGEPSEETERQVESVKRVETEFRKKPEEQENEASLRMQGQYEKQRKIIQSLEHQLTETHQQLNDAGSASAADPDARVNSSVDQGLDDISCGESVSFPISPSRPLAVVNNSLAMVDPRLHESSCDASTFDTTSETFFCPHPPPSAVTAKFRMSVSRGLVPAPSANFTIPNNTIVDSETHEKMPERVLVPVDESWQAKVESKVTEVKQLKAKLVEMQTELKKKVLVEEQFGEVRQELEVAKSEIKSLQAESVQIREKVVDNAKDDEEEMLKQENIEKEMKEMKEKSLAASIESDRIQELESKMEEAKGEGEDKWEATKRKKKQLDIELKSFKAK